MGCNVAGSQRSSCKGLFAEVSIALEGHRARRDRSNAHLDAMPALSSRNADVEPRCRAAADRVQRNAQVPDLLLSDRRGFALPEEPLSRPPEPGQHAAADRYAAW